MFIQGKNFSQDFVFLFSFFFLFYFFKRVYFTFESCLSLIMASGSQLKVNFFRLINSSCQVFYYKYTVSFKYVI